METKKILVVGLQPHDSGKTTLCKALIYGFKEIGLGPIPFKPHSGISYWNQFDIFQRWLIKDALVCSDIMELEKAAQSNLPLEILNPANRLSKPVLDRGVSVEKSAIQEFLAERFTHHNGIKHENIYYLNGAIDLSKMRGVKELYSKIKKEAGKFWLIRNFHELADAYARNFDKATSSCYASIEDKHLIIESFNNAAYPFIKAKDCDTILCSSSDVILQFKTSAYFEAIKLRGARSRLQLTVSDIYTPSLIDGTYRIQPLNSQERNDPEKLIQNYSEIIEQIIE